MKKTIAFVMSLLVTLSVVIPTVTAYEADDPCLLYGYDPEENDVYDTYGDTYFLDMRPVKIPNGELHIVIKPYAARKIIEASISYGSVANIINEDYFPELDIEVIYCDMADPEEFERMNKYYLNYNSYLHIDIKLKDESKEAVTNALIALAPRIDVDIHSVIHCSYDLQDVSNALKHMAGWSTPEHSYWMVGIYDCNGNGEIELSDVTCMLKIIARWDNVYIFI